MEFFDRDLPKWPRLLVLGESIKQEQAREIIYKTDSLDFVSNDRPFIKAANRIVYDIDDCTSGYELYSKIQEKIGKTDITSAFAYQNEKRAAIGWINGLYYLHNHRLTSSWIGGTHGWCNWDGTIKAANYNIGKYPSIKEVYDEWVIIAKAFPFLKLKCQLLNGEGVLETPEELKPVVEFVIEHGIVTMQDAEEDKLLLPVEEPDFTKRFSDPYAERGCTIPEFALGFSIVKNAVQKEIADKFARDNNAV